MRCDSTTRPTPAVLAMRPDYGRRHVSCLAAPVSPSGTALCAYEEICPCRQSLEITVVPLVSPENTMVLPPMLNAPGNGRYAAVNNLRGSQREVACAWDRSDLASCQVDIVCLQRLAAIIPPGSPLDIGKRRVCGRTGLPRTPW